MPIVALVAIAILVILFVVLAWIVIKWLFVVAVVLGLIWLILFFWRGIAGRSRA